MPFTFLLGISLEPDDDVGELGETKISRRGVKAEDVGAGLYNSGGHDLLNFCTNKEALTPVGGYLPVPQGPGLGVDIDEAAVREANKDRHRWRNPIFRTHDGSFAEW